NHFEGSGVTKLAGVARVDANLGVSERQMDVHDSSLAPAVAGESVAGPAPSAAARADEPRDRAHEPCVDGDAFARAGRLARGFQRLREAQRDRGYELDIARGRRRTFLRLLRDVDERRVLPGDAHLDVS